MKADPIICMDSCSFLEGFFHEKRFKGLRITNSRTVLNSYNVNFFQAIKLYFFPQFLGTYKSQSIPSPVLNLQRYTGKQTDISEISLKIHWKLVAFSVCMVIVHNFGCNFTVSRQPAVYFTHCLNS